MTRVLTKYDTGVMSFKAGGTITMNKPVALSAANTVVIATANNYVGVAMPDDAIAAKNAAEQYVSGDLLNVSLRGRVMTLEAGGVFAVGNFVKLGTGGKVVVEATAGTMTVNTIGIALEVGADESWVDILVFA